MNSIDLNNQSSSALNYEIGGSKRCLESHGIKSPNWFAAKYRDVWDNATVINENIINLTAKLMMTIVS